MEGPIIQTQISVDGTRRVDIFRRRNGTYGFEESYWHPRDRCWIPIGPQSDSFTDSLETALREAQGRVSWLGEGHPGPEKA